jgi:AraC-like DNA-binding protein
VAVARAGGTTREPVLRREHGPVRRVRRAIAERPQEAHRLADLAASVGLNPRYLIAAFRDEVGVTPHQYLLAVRVRASKDQLAGGRPVGDVAADLGFADQSHFTRVFRRQVRTTPARFQRLSTQR